MELELETHAGAERHLVSCMSQLSLPPQNRSAQGASLRFKESPSSKAYSLD